MRAGVSGGWAFAEGFGGHPPRSMSGPDAVPASTPSFTHSGIERPNVKSCCSPRDIYGQTAAAALLKVTLAGLPGTISNCWAVLLCTMFPSPNNVIHLAVL